MKWNYDFFSSTFPLNCQKRINNKLIKSLITKFVQDFNQKGALDSLNSKVLFHCTRKILSLAILFLKMHFQNGAVQSYHEKICLTFALDNYSVSVIRSCIINNARKQKSRLHQIYEYFKLLGVVYWLQILNFFLFHIIEKCLKLL